MSRIRVTIDQLVLRGIDASQRKALVETLQAELSRVLADREVRAKWARPHRSPVLRLGRMALDAGPSGARRLGARLGGAIGKGLQP